MDAATIIDQALVTFKHLTHLPTGGNLPWVHIKDQRQQQATAGRLWTRGIKPRHPFVLNGYACFFSTIYLAPFSDR
eukprot:scaffold106237_cov36-Prasinocladus_malaysianus.AAC.1